MRPLPAGAGEAALDVAEKSDSPSLFPVWRVVGVGAKPRTQRAEKDVLSGIDHDSCVSAPHHQIASLRMIHALKFMGPGIEIRGGCVTVRKPGTSIDGVNQMGTVRLVVQMDVGVQRCRNHGQPVICGQSPGTPPRGLSGANRICSCVAYGAGTGRFWRLLG